MKLFTSLVIYFSFNGTSFCIPSTRIFVIFFTRGSEEFLNYINLGQNVCIINVSFFLYKKTQSIRYLFPILFPNIFRKSKVRVTRYLVFHLKPSTGSKS